MSLKRRLWRAVYIMGMASVWGVLAHQAFPLEHHRLWQMWVDVAAGLLGFTVARWIFDELEQARQLRYEVAECREECRERCRRVG